MTGKQKLFWLSELTIERIDEYARRSGLSKSKVVEELLVIGDVAFRKKYILGEETDGRVVEDEKLEVGSELAKNYWKKVMKYEYNEVMDGWTPV